MCNHILKGTQNYRRSFSCQVNIIGAPVSFGQPKHGTDEGPEAIRSTGFIQTLEKLNWKPKDSGDIVFSSSGQTSEINGVKNVVQVSHSCEKIAKAVEESCSKFDRTIVLGGDHSLAIGSLSGHATAHPDVCVIWIDAHPDINTVKSSMSGNMHGMPFSFLIREMIQNESNNIKESLFRWIKGSVSASSFAFIGIRDVDEAEKNFLQTLSLTCFSADDVSKIGANEVMSRILDRINPDLKKPIHVSFDVDALDPQFASSTGTPVDQGLSLDDAISMAKIIQETKKLSVLDVVEVNPLIGSPEQVKQTCKSAHDVIVNFLGSCTSE